MLHHPDYPVCICIEPVKTQFVCDIKNYHPAGSQTYGESEYIYKTIYFVALQISIRGPNIIIEHHNKFNLSECTDAKAMPVKIVNDSQ
jgi:hypothetical protein